MALTLTRDVLSVALKRNQGLAEGKGTPEKVHLTPTQLLRTLAAQENQGNTGKPRIVPTTESRSPVIARLLQGLGLG